MISQFILCNQIYDLSQSVGVEVRERNLGEITVLHQAARILPFSVCPKAKDKANWALIPPPWGAGFKPEILNTKRDRLSQHPCIFKWKDSEEFREDFRRGYTAT